MLTLYAKTQGKCKRWGLCLQQTPLQKAFTTSLQKRALLPTCQSTLFFGTDFPSICQVLLTCLKPSRRLRNIFVLNVFCFSTIGLISLSSFTFNCMTEFSCRWYKQYSIKNWKYEIFTPGWTLSGKVFNLLNYYKY